MWYSTRFLGFARASEASRVSTSGAPHRFGRAGRGGTRRRSRSRGEGFFFWPKAHAATDGGGDAAPAAAWMPPAARSHGWRRAEGPVWPAEASGAERRRRPWTAGAGAQRSAGHGWPKNQGSHGWRPHLHRERVHSGKRLDSGRFGAGFAVACGRFGVGFAVGLACLIVRGVGIAVRLRLFASFLRL